MATAVHFINCCKVGFETWRFVTRDNIVTKALTMLLTCYKHHVSSPAFLQQLICYQLNLFWKSYKLVKISVWYIEIGGITLV